MLVMNPLILVLNGPNLNMLVPASLLNMATKPWLTWPKAVPTLPMATAWKSNSAKPTTKVN